MMAAPDILPAQRRENAEPHERTHPVPWFVLCAVAALTVFGAVYIANEPVNTPGAWGDGRTVDDFRPAAGTKARADGAALYASMCAACHQPGGQGLPGVFPPLAGSEWVTGEPRQLAAIVLQGVAGPIEVRGTHYNGAMPSFKQQLDDQQVAALLTHLRAQWGNTGAAVAPDAVASVRAKLGSATPFAGGSAVREWGH